MSQLFLPEKASSKIRVFSFGGGVQSTAVLALQAQDKLWKPYDVYVFSDVGSDSENPATLKYIEEYTKPFAEKHGIRFETDYKTMRDGSRETVVGRVYRTKRSIPIPARMSNGAPGRRSCTTDFKIKVVDKWIKHQGVTHAVVGLGISIDEFSRMKDERWHDRHGKRKFGFWKRREHLLIDMRIDRNDCRKIIDEAGLPVPPKSSCFFCPFMKRGEWIDMKREQPELFQRAVEIEKHINEKRSAHGRDRVYLHQSAQPLEQAVGDQMTMFDILEDESCDGYCHT